MRPLAPSGSTQTLRAGPPSLKPHLLMRLGLTSAIGSLFLAALLPILGGCTSTCSEITTMEPPEIPTAQRLETQSLVSPGDPARLYRVFAKARKGAPITVGVIGGSITQGAWASSEELRWGNQVAQWWRQTFPDTETGFINAGIGATGSDIGCHRVAADLLSAEPDFVVVEFAVNDGGSSQADETLEGLLRQILRSPRQPAVMLLFTMNQWGDNIQHRHVPVGRYYGLPMISYRDALWPEIRAGRIAWEDIAADDVHPNDRGHTYCAEFITAYLRSALTKMPEGKLPPVPGTLPSPLISDAYEHTLLQNAETLSPAQNDGWQIVQGQFGPAWEAEKSGASLAFEVVGTTFNVIYHRAKVDYGEARLWVDDAPPITLKAHFPQDWDRGYGACSLVAKELDPGPHTLHVEILDEPAPDAANHRFRLLAVLSAGRPTAP